VSFLALQHRHHVFIVSHAIEHCYDCLAHLVTAANEHLRMCLFMCGREHVCESMCIQNARPSATHTHARLRHCTHTTRLNRHKHMRVCVCVCVCVCVWLACSSLRRWKSHHKIRHMLVLIEFMNSSLRTQASPHTHAYICMYHTHTRKHAHLPHTRTHIYAHL
jgi:hypothetical protein